jgi:hypothetical protein
MSPLRLPLGAALLLALGPACTGDSDETAGETSATTSAATTTGVTTTTGETTTSTGTSTTGDTTTSTSTSTSESTGASTSTTDTTTGGETSTTGDSTGDTEGLCLDRGEPGPLDHTVVDQPISEFFDASDFATILSAQDDYAAYFDGQAPADLASEWLVFAHPGRTPIGTRHSLVGVDIDGACSLSVSYATASLGDNCENFTTYTRPAPLLARTPIGFDPPTEPTLIPAPGLPFDCARQGVGEFESCTEDTWCAPGLICAGITRASPGMCMDATLRGVFESLDLDLEFTKGDPLMTTIEATGLATVDMDVIINLVVDHPDPSALTITLTNPSANEVMVWDQEPSPFDAIWYPEPGTLRLSRVPVGFSGDESVNGTWILTITSTSDAPGSLVSWELEIMSRYD